MTARPNRHKTQSRSISMGSTEDGRGHRLQTSTRVASWHVQKNTVRITESAGARPRILHGPNHVFFHRSGTNDREQPRSVSLVPKPFEGE